MLKLFISLGLVATALGHSWLTCVDYLEQNGEYWAGDICRASARHGHQFAPVDGTFGLDTGYNYQPGGAGAPCRTPRDDSGGYNTRNPMAVYYPGQKVVLAHPTKNHVADVRCTSKYIPDNGNKLYLGPRDATADVSLAEFMSNEIWDWGSSPTGSDVSDSDTTTYPKIGYQNAPAFCENMDKALGTYTFNVPSNLQPGRYTFLWGWAFNGGQDLYTGCFEADVKASRAERDVVLRQRGQTTADPVDISGGAPATRPPDVTGPSIDGGWGDWDSWGPCSRTCGDGEQMRVRHCDNPFPENGGKYCEGENEERRPCTNPTCPPSNVKFTYTSNWGSGANAEVQLPNPKPSGQWHLVIQFPCSMNSVQPWHADDVSNPNETPNGKYRFEQKDWQMEKPDIGMTLQFGACSPQEEEVVADIEEL